MDKLDLSDALSSERSSEHRLDKSNDEHGGDCDPSPRSTGRRATRIRASRRATAGMSESDFSEDEDSPRKSRLGGRISKKSGRQGNVLRDESGRPLSPAEARRQRKRITNRESARRMRLLRKEEWNNLQNEVHEKTIELQKSHRMNRQLNDEFGQLEGRCRSLQLHNDSLVHEVLTLVEHLRDNLGKEIDNKRLAIFLRNMSQLLPQQQAQAQHIGQASPHWGGTGYKSLHGGDSRFGHANINVTADASIGYLPEGMKRAASAPEPQPDFCLPGALAPGGALASSGTGKRRRACDSPPDSLSPSHRMPPLHPTTPTVAATPSSAASRDLMPPPQLPSNLGQQPPAAAPETSAQPQLPAVDAPRPDSGAQSQPFSSLVPSLGGSLDFAAALGRIPSLDPQFCAEINANGGLDPQLSIGKLLSFELE